MKNHVYNEAANVHVSWFLVWSDILGNEIFSWKVGNVVSTLGAGWDAEFFQNPGGQEIRLEQMPQCSCSMIYSLESSPYHKYTQEETLMSAGSYADFFRRAHRWVKRESQSPLVLICVNKCITGDIYIYIIFNYIYIYIIVFSQCLAIFPFLHSPKSLYTCWAEIRHRNSFCMWLHSVVGDCTPVV